VKKFDYVLFSFVVEMDRLSNISYASTISHPLVEFGHKTLEHGQTVVLPDNIRVISIDSIIIHSVLDVEECHGSVYVDQNHHQYTCQTYLRKIAGYSQYDVL